MLPERRSVENFDTFLFESENGSNRVYQLHRELGGVFIDASFQHEESTVVYAARIALHPPKYVDSELKWDKFGFVYELESYRLEDGIIIQVPLYRAFGPSMSALATDVAVMVLDESGWAPQDIKNTCEDLLVQIEEIRAFLIAKHESLGDSQRQAVDIFLGEAGIWDYLDNSVYEAMGQLLYRFWEERIDQYRTIANEANIERRKKLADAEVKLVQQHEQKLQEHGFNRGFVGV